MKKFLVLVTALLALGISGCASKAEAAVAEPEGQKVPAYYYGAYVDAEAMASKLESAGFDVVATIPVTKNAETIIITTDALKAAANMEETGFGAVLRVLIDHENNRTSATNPIYFGKAFFRRDYNHELGMKLDEMLHAAMGEVSASADELEYDDLSDYRFMFGMPRYDDADVVGEGETEALMEQLESYKKGKRVLFKLELDDNRALYGVELSKRTSKFVKKIGSQNALVLPYAVLIEDGKAKALAGKYYIAVSYPLLSMGTFMTIATTPGAIKKELEKPFK